MSLQDTLNAAQAIAATAKEAFDKAMADVNTAQAALDAAAPHLTVLDEIESYASHINLDSGIIADFNALIAKARALF